ncbi:MAG: hypothetical protein P8Y15_15825 [Gemmatimonadales bacterium]
MGSRVRASGRSVLFLLLLTAAGSIHATPARAQEAALTSGREPVPALVDYIAGANLYLRTESDSILRRSDSLLVRREPEGPVVGALRVLGTNGKRAVVAFAGDPFALTRGDTLYLALGGRQSEAEGVAAPGDTLYAEPPKASRPTERQYPRAAAPRPRVTGRLSLDFSGLRSETERPGSAGAVVRTFATPSIGLRTRATDLPGGLGIDLNVRASYRASTDSLVRPVTALRLYRATISKSFKSFPLQLQLGRFYNPFEAFSGTWDGLLVHGGRQANGFGGGVAAGFQPIGTEGITADLPKYSLFLNYKYARSRAYYATDFSFHQLRPRDGRQNHKYLGWSNRLRVDRFLLSQRIQVDRNPATDRWTVTNLQASLSASLGPKLSLNAGYSLRQPYAMGSTGTPEEVDPLDAAEGPGDLAGIAPPRPEDPISFRRDRLSGGLSLRLASGTIAADFATSRIEDGAVNYSYSTGISFPRTALAGLGFSAGASYWTQAGSKGLVVTPTISRAFGRVQTQATYQFYRTQNATREITTNAGEVGIRIPISERIGSSIRGRIQRGSGLNSSSLITSFFIAF